MECSGDHFEMKGQSVVWFLCAWLSRHFPSLLESTPRSLAWPTKPEGSASQFPFLSSSPAPTCRPLPARSRPGSFPELSRQAPRQASQDRAAAGPCTSLASSQVHRPSLTPSCCPLSFSSLFFHAHHQELLMHLFTYLVSPGQGPGTLLGTMTVQQSPQSE